MITAPTTDSPNTAAAFRAGTLPAAASVLAVTARPGLESVELGGLLYAFRHAGASLSLLCLTRGEADAHNSTAARLEAIRPWDLQVACSVLGVADCAVASYPDGELHGQPVAELIERIARAIRQGRPDLLLVIAPEAGSRDDVAVALAARTAAPRAGVPVVASTWPGAPGAWTIDLGIGAATARAIQKSAAAAHTSQSDALPALVRRLDLLDSTESLRWLLAPQAVPTQRDERILAAMPRRHRRYPSGGHRR
jgi:N-acetylglucosamine malate deacetylase 2